MKDESKPDKRRQECQQHRIPDPCIGSQCDKIARRVSGNTPAFEHSHGPAPERQANSEQNCSYARADYAGEQRWQSENSVGELTCQDEQQQQAEGDSDKDRR